MNPILLISAISLFANMASSSQLDPEIFMNATELIAYNGYPVEDHYVQTEDGFVLNVQRIPYGKKSPKTSVVKPVVLVQHGLLAGSDCFVMEQNRSLGFILADDGYDVWLGNSRGNVYGRKHVRYNTSQEEFWAWSWDEHAKYDLPATVDYILQQTNQSQLYYIGHSQGTLIAFAGFSSNQALQSKIKLYMALAPIAQLKHIRGILRFIAKPVENNLPLVYKLLGRKDFNSNSTLMTEIAEHVCTIEKAGEIACETVAGLISGFDPGQKNLSRTAVYVAHSDEGTSVRNMIHYAQGVTSGKFQMYDYGSDSENMKHYNQTTPPEYDPSKIKIPFALIFGGNDWLADSDDVDYLFARLPKTNNILTEQFTYYDHLDFVLAMNAPTDLYDQLLGLMKKFN